MTQEEANQQKNANFEMIGLEYQKNTLPARIVQISNLEVKEDEKETGNFFVICSYDTFNSNFPTGANELSWFLENYSIAS